jgi:hypothetical protein
MKDNAGYGNCGSGNEHDGNGGHHTGNDDTQAPKSGSLPTVSAPASNKDSPVQSILFAG